MNMRNVLVFNYGSNSSSQLRARVRNKALESRAAFVQGYTRVFCLRSRGWGGGGVASLCPCAGAITYGSVVSLAPAEKALLDTFEGGYREVHLSVQVIGQSQPTEAIAYVAGIEARSYTPAMSSPPSEAYLTAVHVMLRQNSWEGAVEIRSSDSPDSVAAVWKHPGAHALESLEALAVDLNACLPADHLWEMPAASLKFARALHRAGVGNVVSLAEVLADSDALTDIIDEVSLRVLKDRIHIQVVFVYGSLRHGHRNHFYLHGDASTFIGDARTCDSHYRLFLHRELGFPFVLDDAPTAVGPSTGVPIHGELYAVSTATLHAKLDRLEGHPTFYRRRRVSVLLYGTNLVYSAWMYVIEDAQTIRDALHNPTAFPLIAEGDYNSI